jgi:hypothetical protein
MIQATAQSNSVKPSNPVKPEKIKGSQESEQIMEGPFAGCSPFPKRSNPVKPSARVGGVAERDYDYNYDYD